MEHDKDCGTLSSDVLNMEISDDVIVNADIPSGFTNEVHTVGTVPGENAVVPGENIVDVSSVDALSANANGHVEANNVPRANSVPQPDNLDAGGRNCAVVDGVTYTSRAARTTGFSDNAPQPWRCSVS